jgi:SP family arabinose:H+ symporter-like MFS transporter
MLGLGVLLPIVEVLLVIFVMPETPRWLVMKGKREQAMQTLRKICSSEAEVNETLQEIEANMQAEAKSADWSRLLKPTPGVRRMVLIVVVVAGSQMTCGVAAIGYYTPYFLQDAGVPKQTYWRVQVLMGVVKTSVLVGTAVMLENARFGRKRLLIISMAGIIVSHFMIIFGFPAFLGSNPLLIGGIFSYVIFFSIGIGPICWLVRTSTHSHTVALCVINL